MKNTILAITYFIILIVAGLFLTASLPGDPSGPGTPADSTITQLSAATTAAGTDIIYIVSGGASKKITWATLMSIIRDSLEIQPWVTAGDWSWDGGTFDAGSAGKITMNDSLLVNGGFYANGTFNKSKWFYPFSNNGYGVGTPGTRYGTGAFKYLYADYIILTNPTSPSADTNIIAWDGDFISIGKDSTSIQNLCLSETNYTFSLTTDSVITLSNIKSGILMPKALGFAVPGVETINMAGAGNGQMLVITSYAGYTVTFEDGATTGGNLRLAGNFAMAEDDILTLKYKSSSNYWLEVSRSNN